MPAYLPLLHHYPQKLPPTPHHRLYSDYPLIHPQIRHDPTDQAIAYALHLPLSPPSPPPSDIETIPTTYSINPQPTTHNNYCIPHSPLRARHPRCMFVRSVGRTSLGILRGYVQVEAEVSGCGRVVSAGGG